MRIPIWRNLRLSVWEPQNPDAVRVRLVRGEPKQPMRRVLSMRGWMLLLIRYDWQDHSQPPPDPGVTAIVQDLTRELHRRATHLDTIRGADGDTVPNESWLMVSGEVIGLQGALGTALGGRVPGGDADQMALEHYRAWALEHASEWNRCRCEVCLSLLSEEVQR
ncbi:hypothetical protein [Streptomyces ardesiacus]|uniref:hypothetical protein n=1 Tax=Streptomyces ardesiacus TaxID=285564 RepID=UPI003F49CE2D